MRLRCASCVDERVAAESNRGHASGRDATLRAPNAAGGSTVKRRLGLSLLVLLGVTVLWFMQSKG